MAKTKTQVTRLHTAKPKTKRPGVHAKCKASRSKSSKNWLKVNKGQGR